MRLLSIGCDTRYSENTQIGLAGRNESGDLIRHGPQDTSWGVAAVRLFGTQLVTFGLIWMAEQSDEFI